MHHHHTKDKGDLGVAKTYADLVAKGYVVLFPATEHAPFDLVTYRDDRFARIQVKYRSLRLGTVSVAFKSNWNDRHGTHERRMDKDSIDLVCTYCPDTDDCYYVRPADHHHAVSLRVIPSRNGQKVGVLNAADFRLVPDTVGIPPG